MCLKKDVDSEEAVAIRVGSIPCFWLTSEGHGDDWSTILSLLENIKYGDRAG